MRRVRVNCPNGSKWAHLHEGRYQFITNKPRRLGDDALIAAGGKIRHVRLLLVENGSKYYLVELA
jgi:hypothetical protein